MMKPRFTKRCSIAFVVSLLFLFASHINAKESSGVFAELKRKVADNIIPVYTAEGTRFINLEGKSVNNNEYESAIAFGHAGVTYAFGKREGVWYHITSESEKKIDLPPGYDIEWFYPQLNADLWILRDSNVNRADDLNAKVYNTQKKKFITDNLWGCRMRGNVILGLEPTSGPQKYKAILYICDNNGDFIKKTTEFKFVDVSPPYILAYKPGTYHRNHSTLYDLDFDLILDSTEDFLIRDSRIEKNLLVVSFYANGNYDSMGFVDIKGNSVKKGFYSAYPFSGSLARVMREEEEYMFIDASGKLVLGEEEPFKEATDFRDGIAFITKKGDGNAYAVDETGNILRLYHKNSRSLFVSGEM